MVESDVLRPVINVKPAVLKKTKKGLRFEVCFTKFLIDAMSAAIDSAVLCSHNELERRRFLDIASKPWKLGYNNNNLRV